MSWSNLICTWGLYVAWGGAYRENGFCSFPTSRSSLAHEVLRFKEGAIPHACAASWQAKSDEEASGL
eukprot:3078974-Amphidinium_carterae.1